VYNHTLEVGNSPKLSAWCRSLGTKELAWRVLLEIGAELLLLGTGKFGAVATDAPIDKTS
jgi:hypothetical protein